MQADHEATGLPPPPPPPRWNTSDLQLTKKKNNLLEEASVLGGELYEAKRRGRVHDLNQSGKEHHVEQMVRAPKGDVETSNKVTSRPSERSTPPVFR